MGLTRQRLDELLGRMHGRRIAVIGDAMLDRYLLGDTERISPEAPVPVVRVTEQRIAPGGAANVAANVVALGGAVDLIGVVGEDREADLLRAAMAEAGLDARGLMRVPGRQTTCKTRVVARGQQVVRIDEEEDGPLAARERDDMIARTLAAVADADAVLFEDYDKGAISPDLIAAVMALAAARRIPTVADPKSRCFFDYAGATVFKPNRREFAAALPGIDAASDSDLQATPVRLKVEHLLLTLGADGMVLASRNGGEPYRIVSIARAVFDVSGAGDTVTAWTGAVLAAGGSALEAAEIANLAASVEVTKAGVATVSPEEVRGAFG